MELAYSHSNREEFMTDSDAAIAWIEGHTSNQPAINSTDTALEIIATLTTSDLKTADPEKCAELLEEAHRHIADYEKFEYVVDWLNELEIDIPALGEGDQATVISAMAVFGSETGTDAYALENVMRLPENVSEQQAERATFLARWLQSFDDPEIEASVRQDDLNNPEPKDDPKLF